MDRPASTDDLYICELCGYESRDLNDFGYLEFVIWSGVTTEQLVCEPCINDKKENHG